MVALSSGIQFQLQSDVQATSPMFTLFVESTEGPLTDTIWSLNGTNIINSTSFSLTSVLRDTETATYRIYLRVEGRWTGHYQVLVSNNKPSSASRVVNVYGRLYDLSIVVMHEPNINLIVKILLSLDSAPDPPGSVTTKQVENDQIQLSWIPPPQPITGYRIYTEPRHQAKYWYADSNSSQFTIHSLQEGIPYNVSMLALSPYLPSLVAGPVEVILKQGICAWYTVI